VWLIPQTALPHASCEVAKSISPRNTYRVSSEETGVPIVYVAWVLIWVNKGLKKGQDTKTPPCAIRLACSARAQGIVLGRMRDSHKQTGIKYAQFSLVGASNMLVDLGVFNLLLLLWSTRSPELLVAYNVVALVLANANSYLWNTLWTFREQARHDARQVGKFTAQGLLNVGVGNALLWLVAHGLVAYTDLSPFVSGNLAKVVSMVVASTVSFLFLRHFVFSPKKT